MSSLKVILDGNKFYAGHVDAWRAGVVLADSWDDRGAGTVFVTVVCPPRGRERKVRQIKMLPGDLLADTPTNRSKMLSVGIDPDQPYGRVNGSKVIPKADMGSVMNQGKCQTCGIPIPLKPGTAHWSGCPESPLYDPPEERRALDELIEQAQELGMGY